MEESVLLGTKPLIDSIRHLCECRIIQWRHDSRLLLLLNWFLHIIKRTLHFGEKIWILCSHGKILFLPREHKIHIFSPPCNIFYVFRPWCLDCVTKTQTSDAKNSEPSKLKKKKKKTRLSSYHLNVLRSHNVHRKQPCSNGARSLSSPVYRCHVNQTNRKIMLFKFIEAVEVSFVSLRLR